jgi:signal transduction histidine kinase
MGGEIVLYIKDNGVGIDLERNMHNLFGMYKTFHNNADATGIGLFITKYQVDTMGGHIGVESEVGQGTEFRVYFKANAA